MTYESPYSKMEYHVGYFELGQANWETVFEGNVTTTERNKRCVGIVGNALSNTADVIKVTFNGTEYKCEKKEILGTTYYGADPNDFSTYPFQLGTDPSAGTVLLTQSAGTYSLKIEEPQSGQSGGSSDFSTAKVTVINNKAQAIQVTDCPVASFEDEMLFGGFSVDANRQHIYDVITYKGHAHILEMMTGNSFDTPVHLETEVSVSGNAEYDTEEEYITITGDCTITIS